MQHEGLLAGAFQAVDELLVFGGAEGGDDQRLRFAAGEQRRAMGARQDADFGHDRTHRGEVAAVDALLGVEHRVAHDIGFDVMDQAGIDAWRQPCLRLRRRNSAANFFLTARWRRGVRT